MNTLSSATHVVIRFLVYLGRGETQLCNLFHLPSSVLNRAASIPCKTSNTRLILRSQELIDLDFRYQSVLHFQPLINNDTDTYICRECAVCLSLSRLFVHHCLCLDAENAINTTMASVYLHVEQTIEIHRSETNVTCASLNFCHHRGQCILVDEQWKCLWVHHLREGK